MTALIVLIVLVTVALSGVGHAQSPTATRGALGGVLSPGTTAGALRGAVPASATVGAARGSVPTGAVIGVPRSPSGGTVGAYGGPLPSGGPAGFLSGGVLPAPRGTFRGDVPPDASVGAASAPLPAEARLGEPGPGELAQRLRSEARMSLVDGNYAQGEAMLNRSVRVRERMVGPDHPDVASALEDGAKLLRQYKREAAAADMETRANEIRTRLEPPAPREPERF